VELEWDDVGDVECCPPMLGQDAAILVSRQSRRLRMKLAFNLLLGGAFLEDLFVIPFSEYRIRYFGFRKRVYRLILRGRLPSSD
jgi:hypothetical protein